MDEQLKDTLVNFLEHKIQDVRVLVVGDVMLDRYFYGTATRISPEAPVPVNRVDKKKDTLGGAANVAHNLAQLGCQTYLAGAIGDDHHGRLLIRKMKKRDIHTDGIVLGREKTTTKIRILGGHQQMIRVDFEETDAISADATVELESFVQNRIKDGVEAIILSDYGKGVCTPELCQYVIQEAKKAGIPVFVDPKGNKWDKYKNASYITPNVKEAGVVCGRTLNNNDEHDIQDAALFIQQNYDIDNVMITRSEKGLSLFMGNTDFAVPTVAQEVFDVSGAGDTVISVFAAGVGGNLEPFTAAQLANFAAGIEVGKLGTYAVSREELLLHFDNLTI